MKRIFRRSKSQTSLKINKPLPDITLSTSYIPPVPHIPEKHRQASLPIPVSPASFLSDHGTEDYAHLPSAPPRKRTRSAGATPVLDLQNFANQNGDKENRQIEVIQVYDYISKPTETSTSELKVDKMISLMNAPAKKGADAFTALNTWYTANSAVVSSAATVLSTINSGAIENTVSKLAETTKVVMDGLTALQGVHPFLGIAVLAFKGVVAMNLTRIANNKKVVVLHATMQETMMVLFQIRDLRDPSVQFPGTNETVEGRLGAVVAKIAESIKETGSAIDHYVKKGFLAKTIKSSIYETRLAGFAATFVKHKEDLEFHLTVNTALGVNAANRQLQEQGERMRSMEDAQKQMLSLLQSLTTPRELEIQKFISDHNTIGGAKACIDDDRLLTQLVELSGQTAEELAGSVAGRIKKPLEGVKKILNKELAEDLNEALERNRRTFEKKLDSQLDQLKKIEASLHAESDRVIDEFHRGPHDKIKDKELKAIWQYMGWKGSVKARHFVLGLHDHYAAQIPAHGADQPELSPTTNEAVTPTVGRPLIATPLVGTRRVRRKDIWALTYINVSRVQPILEAVDDDGTGFISIKEVNDFTESRPDKWSLPVWLAYWSQGWHESMNRYKRKIMVILQLILAEITEVKPENRKWADEYMNSWGMNRVDALLRSLREVSPVPGANNAELNKITQEYTKIEERRLKKTLEGFKFDIDDVETVSLITGPGRLERYILPVLYLLFKRHLAITKLARRHILDPEEFWSMAETILNLFKALDERISGLVDVFKQTHVDEDQHLAGYALGLLYLPWKETSWNPSIVKLVPWPDPSNPLASEVQREVDEEVRTVTVDDLFYGPNNYTTAGALDYASDVIWATPDDPLKPHPLLGAWAGYIMYPSGVARGATDTTLAWIWIEAVDDGGSCTGKCDTAFLPLSISGTISTDYQLDLTLRAGEDCTQIVGRLDVESQSIVGRQLGQSTSEGDASQSESSHDPGQHLGNKDGTSREVFLNRTPVSIYRFRYTPEEFVAGPARARWSFACRAVLFQIRQRTWSKSYFDTVLPEKLQLVRFATQHLVEERDWTHSPAYLPLTAEEHYDFELLLKVTPPTEARFWVFFAELELFKVLDFRGYVCDGCDRHIIEVMTSCLECTTDTLTNRIDMCMDCMDKDLKTADFNHTVSHPMLRARDHFMHDGEIAHYFRKGKEIGHRAKQAFQRKEKLLVNSNVKQQKPPGTRCCCCLSEVSTPCWVCADCVFGTYVCDSCETKASDGTPGGPRSLHTHKHPLIRIHDNAIAQKDSMPEETAEKSTVLWKRIDDLESHLNTRLDSLETKFTAMEALLERLIDATVRNVDTIVSTPSSGR
ncbi:hypothetical protein K435DRAFT_860160 [Dendrothele bispora CBS 962.96]|uniref:EF-hand domain-containing protein n=1 Tax=Dendrothele bispora (strain CBS 962.96) TaxID=1314807 RepID=A0A4S8LQX0_DENBC|nr:hypothetical protein K435DRAFT_863210 [Dendrothele bispora CBS 962.96]THU94879.1 hypothetical protein K435DRAFT_860160 [Dendrothele bispora CBS 962.96]